MDTAAKLYSFTRLPEGWYCGEGHPCDMAALLRAFVLLENMVQLGFTETDAFPGIDGSVMLTMYDTQEPICLEFHCEVDNTVTFVHEREDAVICDEEGLTLAKALAKLRAYAEEKTHAE